MIGLLRTVLELELVVLLDVRSNSLPNLVLLHQSVDLLDIGAHEAIASVGSDVLTDKLVHLLQRLGGLLVEQPHTLAGSQQLDGNHVLDVLSDLDGLASAEASHGHVILLTGGGGDGIHGTGVSEDLVLGDESSSAAVSNHETGVESTTTLSGEEGVEATQRGVDQTLQSALGDVGDLVNGNGQEVQSLSGILTVEVSSGDDDGGAVLLAEDHGVIGGRVQLGGDDTTDELEGIVGDTVHLRSATEGVGILHLLLIGELLENVAGPQLVVQQGTHALGALALTSVLTSVVDEVTVSSGGSAESLEGHAGDDIGLESSTLSADESLSAESGDELSSVDEGKTLLSTELHRGELVLGDQLLSGLDSMILGIPSLSLSNQTQAKVGERSEISRGADSSLEGNHRHDSSVEEVYIMRIYYYY